MLLMPPTGTVDIVRVGSDNKEVTLFSGVNANLQSAKMGAPVASPWAMPGQDADIGGALLAAFNMFLDGDDGLAGYRPRPGDRLVYTSLSGETSRNGTYKVVADPVSDELIPSRKLPVCKVKDA